LEQNRIEQGAQIWKELWDGQWTVAKARTERGLRTLVLRRPKGGAADRLTQRERIALALTVRGRPLKHIAFDLGTSVPTACDLVKRALRKLGLRGRLEVAHWCVPGELAEPSPAQETERRDVA
jgi:DNA-binding CsgD family transcriptional regulator